MSQTNEPKQYKVTIVVEDEQGTEIWRKYNFDWRTNYTEAVEDIINTIEESNDNN